MILCDFTDVLCFKLILNGFFRARGLLKSCRGGTSAAAVKALGLIRARICPATGTALPQPVHFGLEQFGQHMAGLLQILESPGEDSGKDCVLPPVLQRLRWAGRFLHRLAASSRGADESHRWHICIKS